MSSVFILMPSGVVPARSGSGVTALPWLAWQATSQSRVRHQDAWVRGVEARRSEDVEGWRVRRADDLDITRQPPACRNRTPPLSSRPARVSGTKSRQSLAIWRPPQVDSRAAGLTLSGKVQKRASTRSCSKPEAASRVAGARGPLAPAKTCPPIRACSGCGCANRATVARCVTLGWEFWRSVENPRSAPNCPSQSGHAVALPGSEPGSEPDAGGRPSEMRCRRHSFSGSESSSHVEMPPGGLVRLFWMH